MYHTDVQLITKNKDFKTSVEAKVHSVGDSVHWWGEEREALSMVLCAQFKCVYLFMIQQSESFNSSQD